MAVDVDQWATSSLRALAHLVHNLEVADSTALQFRNPRQLEWSPGTRSHQPHGDGLRIATAADFCGTRWQINAVIIQTNASPDKLRQ